MMLHFGTRHLSYSTAGGVRVAKIGERKQFVLPEMFPVCWWGWGSRRFFFGLIMKDGEGIAPKEEPRG